MKHSHVVPFIGRLQRKAKKYKVAVDRQLAASNRGMEEVALGGFLDTLVFTKAALSSWICSFPKGRFCMGIFHFRRWNLWFSSVHRHQHSERGHLAIFPGFGI